MRYYRDVGNIPSVVTLDEARAQLRVDHDGEDLLIQSLIDAATERAEQETGLVFGEGEWIIETEPRGDVVLPVWPVHSIVSVIDAEDAAFSDYTIIRPGRRVLLQSSTFPASLTIRVVAGMDAPQTVRQAVLMMVAYWYDQRATASTDAVRAVPYGASALLGLNRRMFA